MTHLKSKLLAVVCLGLAVGCQNSGTRSAVDLGRAKIPANHDPIIVDANMDAHAREWDGAKEVPISTDGKAQFMWDDKGLYGHLASKVMPSSNADESVCISMSMSNPAEMEDKTKSRFQCVNLYVTSAGTNEISARLSGTKSEENFKAKFAGKFEPAKQGTPWQAEFFIPWQLLCGSETPEGTFFVQVYRIKGERPYSLLEMKFPAK